LQQIATGLCARPGCGDVPVLDKDTANRHALGWRDVVVDDLRAVRRRCSGIEVELLSEKIE
jgi:hypothetical protein